VNVAFTPNGWADYQHWLTTDRAILKRLNQLLADTLRHPTEGIGKPEQLRYGTPDTWSRRIDLEHRLVYQVRDDSIVVLAARYHYDR
jgi:toxin YoeB